MKVSKLIFLFLIGIMIGKAQTKKQMNDQTIYQFEVEDITGKAFPLIPYTEGSVRTWRRY